MLPVYLRPVLTHRCVNSCVFCSGDFTESKGDMNWEFLKDLSEKFRALGGSMISFSGGEPMLWSHLADAAIFAKSIGLKTRITTNFLLAKPELLRDIDCVHISIHSLDKCDYQRISRPAAFYDRESFVGRVERLSESGRETRINSVYRPESESGLLDLIRVFTGMGIMVDVMNDMLEGPDYFERYLDFCRGTISKIPLATFRERTNPGWKFCQACELNKNCASTRALWAFADNSISLCPRKRKAEATGNMGDMEKILRLATFLP